MIWALSYKLQFMKEICESLYRLLYDLTVDQSLKSFTPRIFVEHLLCVAMEDLFPYDFSNIAIVSIVSVKPL